MNQLVRHWDRSAGRVLLVCCREFVVVCISDQSSSGHGWGRCRPGLPLAPPPLPPPFWRRWRAAQRIDAAPDWAACSVTVDGFRAVPPKVPLITYDAQHGGGCNLDAVSIALAPSALHLCHGRAPAWAGCKKRSILGGCSRAWAHRAIHGPGWLAGRVKPRGPPGGGPLAGMRPKAPVSRLCTTAGCGQDSGTQRLVE